jgi:hypothetical protein
MIERVNTFPIGMKRYMLGDGTGMGLAVASRLTQKYYDAVKHISEQPNTWLGEQLKAGWGYNDYVRRMEPLTSEKYPIFKLTSAHMLHQICVLWISSVVHNKDFYQEPMRVANLHDMAYFDGMEIQYDEKYNALKVLNVPYEGPLVKTANFSKVNKFVSGKVRALKSELLMEGLIMSAEGRIEVPNGFSWRGTPQLGKDLINLFDTVIVKDTADFETRVAMSLALRQYTQEHYYSKLQGTPKIVLKATEHNYKWYPGPKRNIYFQYGAYELPSDYQDWFDK